MDKKSGQPSVVRLSVINPFLLELRERGCNARQLLVDMALPPDVPASPEIFVPIEFMYKLVEATAVVAKDRCFGFKVGRALDIRQWDALAESAEMSTTVGELLTHFVHLSGEHATTAYFLRCGPKRAVFGFEWQIKPPFAPAQYDAFYTGMLDRAMQEACGDAYDASAMLSLVSDPSVIPGSWQGRVGSTDVSGPQISFPTEWVFAACSYKRGQSDDPISTLPDSLLQSIDFALRPYVAEVKLSADRAATLCGYSRRRLSSQLRKRGTTIGTVIAALRARVASDHLAGTSESVAEIGRRVGYPDPTMFSRAFKKWTGQCPTEFRRQHMQENVKRRVATTAGFDRRTRNQFETVVSFCTGSSRKVT